MDAPDTKFRNDMTEVIAWSVATPVLSVWALVSLLPIAGLIEAWGDPVAALIALAFLGTGAVALLTAALGSRLLMWNHATTSVPSRETRTRRVMWLSGYALVWMALYGWYSLG